MSTGSAGAGDDALLCFLYSYKKRFHSSVADTLSTGWFDELICTRVIHKRWCCDGFGIDGADAVEQERGRDDSDECISFV